MSTASIPVIAHLGLRPQSIHTHGGYRVQGKDADSAREIIEDAALMESAGAVALLLEAVPAEVARIIAARTTLPVIGCVAGPHCDGTVVVMHDILGYTAGHPPRSVKQYANLQAILTDAFRAFVDDVGHSRFHGDDGAISMPADELNRLRDWLSVEAPLSRMA